MGIPAPAGVSASGLPPAGDQANAVLSGQILAIGPTAPFAFRGPMNMAFWRSINTALTTTAGSASATVASATGLAVGNAINSTNVPKGTTIGALAATTATLAFPAYTYPASNLNLRTPNRITLPPGSNVAQLIGATVTAPGAQGVTVPSATTVTSVVQTDVAPSGNSPGQSGIVELSAAFTAVPQNGQALLQFALGVASVTATGADANATFTGAAISYTGTINIERSFDGGATWLLCNIGGAGQVAQYAAGTPVTLTFGEPEKQVLYRLNCIAFTTGPISYRISQTGAAAESLSIGALI